MFDTMPVDSNVFIPRPYQIEIFEMAKQQNTIVCLGTGTGKTFIAVMLIDHYSHQLRGDYEESGKRTIVIVPKVPLVHQQASFIRNHLYLEVGEYTGDMKSGTCDTWDKQFWIEELKKNHVLVMTAEIFRMMITHGIMSLSKVNLLILDEAHWAIGDHPYKEIMRCFDNCDEPPRILGLTASLINRKAKPKDIRKLIADLERTLKAKCETASDLRTVSKCGTKPEEVLWYYSSPKCIYKNRNVIKVVKEFESLMSFLSDLKTEDVHKSPMSISQIRKCLGTTAYILGSMGYWCGRQVSEMFISEFAETTAMLSNTEPIYSGLLSAASTVMNYLRGTINCILNNYCRRDRLIRFASPKLYALMDILREYKPLADESDSGQTDFASKPLCGIIFAERRAVVQVLYTWLQELAIADSENFGFLKVDFVLGHGGNTSGVGSRMSNKRQEDALSRFRKHECNLLIATSVLEEGLDVPRCNLVVRYDMPKSFREYIQSKGRARAEKARYVMLIENEETNANEIKSTLKEFVEIEQILMESCCGRESPTEQESEEFDDNLLPPFMPNKGDGAPRVTINSAIALVNRYCLKLPSDSFTKLAPHCVIEEINGGFFQCSIRLPINSPIRDVIYGQPMPNKKLAKKAAALEVCKRLHKEHELDDNLLPVGKEAIKDIADLGLDDFDDDNERGIKGQARPGTTKRRQYYTKRIASALTGPTPPADVECRLYVFNMKLTCPIPDEQNTRGRKITDPADTPRCLGLITNNPVPRIPSFPVFTRSGEVLVTLEETSHKSTFSTEELTRLRSFHHFLFHNVLRLDKDLVQFDSDSANCSFFVVPVLFNSNVENDEGTSVIDWNFVSKVEEYEKYDENELSEEQRQKFTFDKTLYEDAVVKPWYRRNKVQFYFYVAEITNLTPLSPFPDAGHESFEEYYKEKYNLRITNIEQNLLDVDHTSARLNLLTPRYVNRKGMTLPMSTQKTKKSKRENLQEKQILVPELCIVHPFPASFWRKVVCLPCILYRLNSLLVAEELRREVALSIRVGIVELPPNEKWPQLDFGWTLADVITQSNEEQTAITEDATVDVPHTEDWNSSFNADEVGKSDEKTDAMKSDSDFIIDHFDPAKYSCDDTHSISDDMDVALDVADMNDDDFNKLLSGGTITYPIGAWGDNLNDSKHKQIEIKELNDDGNPVEEDDFSCEYNVGVRVGSPSRFENHCSNWDTAWDDESTEVFNIGVPGLTTISGPKGFNLQELSEDLATCQEENWNVFDEYDSDDELPEEDDEAAEFDPYYERKPNNVAANSNKNKRDLVNDILVNGLLAEPSCVSVVESEENLFVGDLCASSKCDVVTPNDSVDVDNYFKIVPAQKENDDSFEKDCEDELIAEFSKLELFFNNENKVLPCDTIERINSVVFTKNEYESSKKHIPNKEPCFGELLSNREAVHVPASKFRFDPLKSDDAQSNGPNPSAILQALTMSNASDGINLERLETVGDSFLKYAVTAFLYCFCPSIHEGKLSFLRSRQISNYNLYRLGKLKRFGELMVATKFEPNDNWLPPGFMVPSGLEQALIDTGNDTAFDTRALKNVDWENLSELEMREKLVKLKSQMSVNVESQSVPLETFNDVDFATCTSQPVPYNILTQHSIPDKSIADCVEALIGAYLISSGAKGAMLFMKWLGLKVMHDDIDVLNQDTGDPFWHWLPKPKSPLIFDDLKAKDQLQRLYLGSGLDRFEKEVLRYEFRDKAYLVQAFTHNSYCDNYVTDCYQRLEFLGDAVLDFLITRHLYEDPQKHSPGVLTDLRSALVNNTFFATLAVRYDFQKFLKVSSCDLFRVISKFVEQCTSRKFITVGDENLYMAESECESSEEVEVPKALGDIFESVAGAIFLDSGMSLDSVWRVYYEMMKPEIERFSQKPPKSHIRELLEAQPQNAVFGKPEVIPGRKVRVVVEVFNEGKFVGIGRNKRLAKCTAAKRALRALRAKHQTLSS
ncbi:endoribonuclease Dicer-like protein [Leptotrombidium deliense]|uniref:Endoribonuclease Dicer-like protein n=1 Tax=Leptotrombidium deliense TaxID=299467 RepID=A0A443SV28_9ACAR|nr:endoribonuclease Dicer-like protein [Leptotrombidium deliense]